MEIKKKELERWLWKAKKEGLLTSEGFFKISVFP